MPVATDSDNLPSWKAYTTPTKSAAKVLEELVAHQYGESRSGSLDSLTTLASFSSTRSPRRRYRSPSPPRRVSSPEVEESRSSALNHTEISHTSPAPPPVLDTRRPFSGENTTEKEAPPMVSSYEYPSLSPPASSKDTSHVRSLSPHTPAKEILHPTIHEPEIPKRHRHRHSERDRVQDATPSLPSSRTTSHSHLHSHSHSPPPVGHGHRSAHSHSHSRSASDSISVLMLLSKERLAREVARAQEAERRAADAERQAMEVMALFRSTHEAKTQLERELHRVREELGLYKVQLDTAQKEIFRAQEIVDRVEHQRVRAEEELARARDKVRRLSQTLAVEHAMEDGRRAGFEEGLKQGRVIQQAQAPPVPWDDFYERSERKKRRPTPEDASEVSSYSYPQEGSGSSSSSKSIEAPPKGRSRRTAPSSPGRRQSTIATQSVFPQVSTYNTHPPPVPGPSEPSTVAPVGSQPPKNPKPPAQAPDVAKYPEPLPIRTMATPVPLRAPSTQPPPPQPMPPPRRPPEAIKIRASEEGPSGGAYHALLQRQQRQQHQQQVVSGGYSPSVGHESIFLPPDNYIPVMGANSVISLPPPHEMSAPVPAESVSGRRSEKGMSVGAAKAGEKMGEKAGAASSQPGTGRGLRVVNAPPVRAPRVESTHLSEMDMLASPRPFEIERGRTPAPGQSRARSGTTSEGGYRAYQPPPAQYRSTSPKGGKDLNGQRPRTAEPIPPPYTRPGSAAATRAPAPVVSPNHRAPTPGQRRAREVAFPVALGDPFDDPSTANGHASPVMPRSATPGAGRVYGRPVQRGERGERLEGLERPRMDEADRRVSAATIPDIDVETPTTTQQSVPSNRTTVVDPVLLTPDAANRPVPLPEQHHHEQAQRHADAHGHREHGLGLYVTADGEERIMGRLPDDTLPPGFVPLSPIVGVDNLTPYPPEFAPRERGADFRYGGSPVRRGE